MKFNGDYSVLLPGGPQTAAQAANQAFPGATPQTVLPELTVYGTYSDKNPSVTPAIDTTNWDLNPIQVTAQKIAMPGTDVTSSIMDWLQPPKLFLVLGIGAVGLYFYMQQPKRRKGRR
jgi:hypothetical protein